jgi:hypothetical protein
VLDNEDASRRYFMNLDLPVASVHLAFAAVLLRTVSIPLGEYCILHEF